LKIVKHCNENFPVMVAGSLLGLDVNGILEVTYSYPFPTLKPEGEGEETRDDIDGQDYQLEMMKMLREVNMDNNCVGWYQSAYMGTYSTNEVVGYQESYQSAEDLSANSVVIIYDPVQSKKGQLSIKAFRLSDEYMRLRKSKKTTFVQPSNVLVELPIFIKNTGLASAFLCTLQDSHGPTLNSSFDSLALTGSDVYMEKNLELMSGWSEDLTQDQSRFQQYAKTVAKQRQEQIRWLNVRNAENLDRAENGEPLLPATLAELKPLPDAPAKTEPVLMIGQMEVYTKQLNEHIETSFEKLYAASQFYSAK
jgi:translation initiation factor 3 subunit H